MNFKDQNILITGGSSGIGKSLIAELYSKGVRNFAVIGRDVAKMHALKEQFPDAKFILLQGNIGNPVTVIEAVRKINAEWKVVDLLINNAGVVSAGPLAQIEDQDIVDMISINLTGVVLLTKHCLPLLKAAKEATIINVSSGLGLVGMAFYAPYAATKGAIKQFSEALRREFIHDNIHVMTLYPTGTDTPMMKTAATTGLDDPDTVAKRTIEALIGKEIEVVMGGESMQQNRKLNNENPLQLDEKLKPKYNALFQRASGHRAM